MNADVPVVMGANSLTMRHFRRLGMATSLLALCFCLPLLRLLSFSWHSELFSYIILIPFISGYLIWSIRNSLSFDAVRPCWLGAAISLAAGGVTIAGYWIARHQGWQPEMQDYLSVMMLAAVFCFWSLCFVMMGSKLMGQIFFPMAFLIFLVPMPIGWLDSIDFFFQQTSAFAAEIFLKAFREHVVRDGLDLRLSRGIALRVEPECSGIHSTMVLVITSLLAGYLFLKKPWTRTVLVLATIPLAILRNGFRIFVIGWLCVHINPKMINSPIHTKGGPIFFALSLIPFFFLLLFLRKRDSAKPQPKTVPEN